MESKRFELRRIAGSMVGYDYVVWDNHNKRLLHTTKSPDEVFYTDDLQIAELSVDSLNDGGHLVCFDRWLISMAYPALPYRMKARILMDKKAAIETVEVNFPTVELPEDHYWLIRNELDYWSVKIIDIGDYWNMLNIIAYASDVSFDRAVERCLEQLSRPF